jgi:peptidoglycan/xylan/chitin deacetylase (PgdA/CDA1 family)
VAPRKPDNAAQLAAMGVKSLTGNAGVALTFDDGPHPVHTPEILALLRKYKIRAVFCVVGSEVRRYPQLTARIAREGHTLCNHSWRHELGLGSWPAPKIRDNLARTSAEIRRAVPGARIPYFRQPGGKWTPVGVRIARELGMVSLGWSVDPKDWEKPPPDVISSRVLALTTPGSVILLHDAGGDRSSTVAACRGLLPALKGRHKLVLLR